MSKNQKYISSYVLFFIAIAFLIIYSSPNYSNVVKEKNRNINTEATHINSYASLGETGFIDIELDAIPLGTYIDLNNISLIYFLPVIIVVICFICILFSSRQFKKKDD